MCVPVRPHGDYVSVSGSSFDTDWEFKFRKLEFIEYNGGLKIHTSLLSVVLHD